MMPIVNKTTEPLVSPNAVSSVLSAETSSVATDFAQLFQSLQASGEPSTVTPSLLPELLDSPTPTSPVLMEASLLTPEFSAELSHASVLTALSTAIHGLSQGMPIAHQGGLLESSSDTLASDDKTDASAEDVVVSHVTMPSTPALMLVDPQAHIFNQGAQPMLAKPLSAAVITRQVDTSHTLSNEHLAVPASQVSLPSSLPANGSASVTMPAFANLIPANFMQAQLSQEGAQPSTRDAALVMTGDAILNASTPELPKIAVTSLSGAQGVILTTQSSQPLAAQLSLTPHALLDPGWSDAFGQRIAFLAQQGSQTATLQMNPADLGPIQVRISLNDQQAKVEFNTLQQTTSDLITAAMPRLAAALEQQGLRLDESRVTLQNQRSDAFNSASGFASRQDSAGQQGGSASPQASALEHRQALELNQERAAQERSASRTTGKTAVDYYA